MGIAIDDGVLEHGVAAQRAVIGLIVADDEVLVLGQHVDQRPRHPVVQIPEDADMPGPLPALHDRREGMHREDEGRLAGSLRDGSDHRADGVVIGPVEAVEPPFALLRREGIVSRHDGAVIELANERRIVLATIGVDQQPRKIGDQRRHAEQGREFARHRLDADIVGDVAIEFRRRQAEAAIVVGQVAAGMIGQKHDASLAVALDNIERRENCGSGHWREMVCSLASGEGAIVIPRRRRVRNAVVWPRFPRKSGKGRRIVRREPS